MEMRRPILSAEDWYVLGAEEDLTPAYTVASWTGQHAGEYAELISGRTADQVDSLDSSAEFIKSFLDTEEEMETDLTFQSDSGGNVTAINRTGAVVKTLQFPKVFGLMEYHENSSGGWYVLSGPNDENASNAWEREDYYSLVSTPISDANNGTYSQSGNTYKAFVDYLRCLYKGVNASTAPYMQLKQVYRDRWGLYGKGGELITGTAYDSLTDAVVTALRICDFSGFGLWKAIKNNESNYACSSIRCTYNTWGERVYAFDSLNKLKKYLTVTAVFSDGTEFETDSYSLSGTLSAGTRTITASCYGKTATFSVTVSSATVTSLTCTYKRSKNIFDTDQIDELREGMTVIAYYSDNVTEELDSSAYSLSGTLTSPKCNITVSYGGKSRTLEILVTPGTTILNGIVYDFFQGANVFYESSSLDLLRPHLTVYALYSDGSKNVITGYTLSGTMQVGTSKITISYSGKTIWFNVNVLEDNSIVKQYKLSDGTLNQLVKGSISTRSGIPIIDLSGYYNVITTSTGLRSFNYRNGGSGSGSPSSYYPVRSISGATKAIISVLPRDLRIVGSIRKYVASNYNYSMITSEVYGNGVLQFDFDPDDPLFFVGQIMAQTGSTAIPASSIQDVIVSFIGNPIDVVSITCSFDQGLNYVYETDSLDTLKQYLTVTASYVDGTSAVLPDNKYELSGTLTAGTISTVTVTHKSRTATFDVIVNSMIRNWDFTTSLTDTIAGETLVPTAASGVTPPTRSSNGLVFNAATQRLLLSDDYQPVDFTIEIDVASFAFAGDSTKHIRFLMNTNSEDSNVVGSGSLIFRAGYGWSAYGFTDSALNDQGFRAWDTNGWGTLYSTDKANALSGKTVKVFFEPDGKTRRLYLDNELVGTITNLYFNHHSSHIAIGGASTYSANSGDQCYNMTITGIRLYRGIV